MTYGTGPGVDELPRSFESSLRYGVNGDDSDVHDEALIQPLSVGDSVVDQRETDRDESL